MIKKLTATVTNTSNILSIVTTDSHNAPTSTAQITAVNTSLNVGDYITVNMGYEGDTFLAFTGYVKEVELKEPERFYTITAANVLIRALDYFIAAPSPTEPYKWSNITAEDLIEEVLRLSGLTSFSFSNTSFTFAVYNSVEVNLTSALDYARFIADIVAYNLYADTSGVVKLRNRRPYPVGGDTPVASFNTSDIITIAAGVSDRDLRNKIVVYGTGNISATASASSPYLPPGYYRTVVVAAPGVIDTQSMAEQAADYNLDLLNKLTYRIGLTIPGTTGLEARTVVTVTDAGLGISAEDYYVYSIEHNWSRTGYVTNMELRK